MPEHFMIPCDFGGRKSPFPIYVGEPKPENHPLQNQAWWLSTERGGTIPQEVMDSFEKLHKIAKENNISFEELCVYAMKEASGSGGAPAGGGSAPKKVEGAAPAAPAAQQAAGAPTPQPAQHAAQQQTPAASNQERVETQRDAAPQDPNQGQG